VVIAALLVTVAEAQPGMMGMFPPMMPPKKYMEKPGGKILTCQLNFRDVNDPSVIVNSISINIRQRDETYSGTTSLNQIGMHMATHGNKSPGLEAKIGIFSATGGKVTVAITETARPQDGCVAESFGRFLREYKPRGPPITPKIGAGMLGKYGAAAGGIGMPGFGIGGGMQGYGMTSVKSHTRTPFGATGMASRSQGFGGMSGIGGYGGMGGMGAMGGMGGFGMMGMRNPMMMGGMGFNPMMGIMGHQVNKEHPGVLATTDVAPGIKASIVIDRLKSFDRLEQIAGRGVVVCPADNIEYDFDMNSKCSGGILSCCALHYDREEVHLGGNAAMAHHDVHYTHDRHAPVDRQSHNYHHDH